MTFSIAVIETTAVVADGASSMRTLQLLNVIVQTDSYALSLVRYIPDLIEFDQLIKCHYHKVKIPFPVLSQEQQIRSIKAKRRTSLRQLFTSLHHHHHHRSKTNAEKVELYLQQCLLDPVVSQSSIVRDFFSIQRDEDQKLPIHPLGIPPTPPIVNVTIDKDNNKIDQQDQDEPTKDDKDDDIKTDDLVSLRDILRDSISPPPIPTDLAQNESVPIPEEEEEEEVEEIQPFPLDYFDKMTVLGKGCMGKVFLVRSNINHQLYALKSIVKELVIEQREITHTLTEREILATLADIQHPNLAKIYLAFQDTHRLYLVTDYYCGGDLATQMSTCMTFSKQRTLFYAAEMIEGIGELHRLGVLYRDLKPENVLLTKEGHVVLTDFGLSKWLVDTHYTETFCGTAEYLAPEVLTGEPYSFGIDHWSYGTILYEMLAGITPFWADNHMEMYRRVLEDPLEFPAQDENGLPEIDFDTADFLSGLLDRDPSSRLGAQGVDEIKSHPYFADISWDDVYHQRLQPPYVPLLTSHLDFSNFDPTFLEMSPTLTPIGSQVDLTQDMQDVFEGYSFTNQDLAPKATKTKTSPSSSSSSSTDMLLQDSNKTDHPTTDDNHSDNALVPTNMDDDEQHDSVFQPARKRGSVSMLSDIDSFHLDSPLPIHHDQRTTKRRNTHDEVMGGESNHRNEQRQPTVDSYSTNIADGDNIRSSSLVPDIFFLDKTNQQSLDQFDFGKDDLDLRFSVQVNEKQAGFAANQTMPTCKPKKQKYSTRRFLSPFIRF
ncbi:kinase-like domain-containing protein [Halteromyces radiatus]|uniref:kinase-like domain-containing protein n=1 Tax=Halteromyces radiatus TaxID=101107 RepID=UPI00221E6910|nr:kinase-like domain-containing protein [Halteromyces radiatus]KAI8096869.1 kinase-like domain-containing protein [Halteromyces radiatus]